MMVAPASVRSLSVLSCSVFLITDGRLGASLAPPLTLASGITMLIGKATIDRSGSPIPARYRLFQTITGQLEGDLLVDPSVQLHAFVTQHADDQFSISLNDGRIFQFVVTGATLPDTLHVLGRVLEGTP
jgi:hypothetical protein